MADRIDLTFFGVLALIVLLWLVGIPAMKKAFETELIEKQLCKDSGSHVVVVVDGRTSWWYCFNKPAVKKLN